MKKYLKSTNDRLQTLNINLLTHKFELINNKISIASEVKKILRIRTKKNGSCEFDCISIYCVFIYYSNVFFPVEPENDIRFFFFEKSVIQTVFNFKVIFSLFNTEKLKLEQFTFIHKI